jgi:hypothetical protein
MILLNLTPHPINILDAGDRFLASILPEGLPARCEECYTPDEAWIYYENVVISRGTLAYTRVYNLPDPIAGTSFIVSVLVAQQFPNRDDLLVPYDIVRKSGQIIGCRKLVRIR